MALICNCTNEDGSPDSSNHVQSVDKNNEVVVECTVCGRFNKFVEPQEGIPAKETTE